MAGLLALTIFALPYFPHFYVKMVFLSSFISWAVVFYFKKLRASSELVTDGVWWIPYFLVLGLGILSFSEKYRIMLNEQSWERLLIFAFLLAISGVLLFWEWPPWFDKKKNLVTKGKRTLLAYLFFAMGLVVWTYAGLSIMNQAADCSMEVVHDCLVTEKVVMGHRYGVDTEYIIFAEPADGHRPYTFFVSADEFNLIKVHSTRIRVWSKEGYFHSEWTKGFKFLNL